MLVRIANREDPDQTASSVNAQARIRKGQGAEALDLALCVAPRKLGYTGIWNGISVIPSKGEWGGGLAYSKNYPFCMYLDLKSRDHKNS